MQGTIDFVGPRPKRTVERDFVSEVKKWVERESSTGAGRAGRYAVQVTSEGDPAFYHCRVEAVLEGCRWLAQGSGKNPLCALASALKKMRVRGKVPTHAA